MSHSADYTALSLADALLRRHEGTRQFVYQCSAGKQTIGVGRNLVDRGVLPDEIELMLANDIKACAEDLRGFEWWADLTPNRKAALIDLRFCVGPGGFRGFKKMLSALEVKDYREAAEQIIDSDMARKTKGGGIRCQELAGLIRVG